MNPTLQPTRTLVVHPALRALPLLPEGAPERIALTNSIADLGVLEPLKLHKGRVIDGRERLRACIDLGRDEVPCVEVPVGDLHSVILVSLVARKHYSASALAYLAFPHVQPVMEEARARKMACLRMGEVDGEEARRPLSGRRGFDGEEARRSLIGLRGAQTIEEIAKAVGIGRTFLYQARMIHGHFAKNAKLQEIFEAKILSGELGLSAVLQGIAGWDATAGKPRNEREQLVLWDEKFRWVDDGRKWAGWDKEEAVVREHVKAKFLKGMDVWPAEVVEAVAGEAMARGLARR